MKITDVAVAEKFNDMIIYTLAHDLRQPFASLIELADMVMKPGRVFTDDELCRIFENVDSTSSISLEILNGLLCWCKINKEGVEFERQGAITKQGNCRSKQSVRAATGEPQCSDLTN